MSLWRVDRTLRGLRGLRGDAGSESQSQRSCKNLVHAKFSLEIGFGALSITVPAMKRFLILAALSPTLAMHAQNPAPPSSRKSAFDSAPQYTYRVVRSYPHDRHAFTEGL